MLIAILIESFLSFDPLNHKFPSGFRLINNFSSSFSFHYAICKVKRPIFANVLMDPTFVIVVSNTSIKNNITTSISHVYLYNNGIKKTIYHAVSVSLTKTELFAIRCGINQAVQISKVSHIIFMVEKNFDSKIHFYQLQLIVIAQDLRVFSNKYAQNSIDFWNCPSNTKWSHYILVDKETKKFNLTPILSCKVL